jgi:hypothetical protein
MLIVLPYECAAPPSMMRDIIICGPSGVSVPPLIASLSGPFYLKSSL